MKTDFECIECGHKFRKKLGPRTYEIQCPKCKGYDVELGEAIIFQYRKDGGLDNV
jgi:hypothetical protein